MCDCAKGKGAIQMEPTCICCRQGFLLLENNKEIRYTWLFQFDKVHTNSHLLEGTGKQMRHIKLKGVEDIQEFNIQAMLEEVLEL